MKLLMDLRTGEPVVGLEGNLTEINIDRSFRQYLDVLLRTPVLSEQLVPTWGMDYRKIVISSGHPLWESIIKFLIAESLSPSVEPLITEIESIELDRTTDEELKIEINVKSAYGTTTRNIVEVSL